MSQYQKVNDSDTVTTISSGQNTVASGVMSVVMTFASSESRSFSMDVTDVGTLDVDFDIQDQVSDVDSFSFNFPKFTFEVHDRIVDSQGQRQSLSSVIDSLTFNDPIEVSLTLNNNTDVFFTSKIDISLDVEARKVTVESMHPVVFGIPPINTSSWSYSDQAYVSALDSGDFSSISIPRDKFVNLAVRGRISSSAENGYTHINQLDNNQDLLSADEMGSRPSMRVFDFIEQSLLYYSGGAPSDIVSALYSSDTRDIGNDIQYGFASQAIYGENYENITSNDVTFLLSANPIGINDNYTVDRTKIPTNDDQLKEVLLKAASMEGAYFGHMLGRSYYVCRNLKPPSDSVSLGEDDFLELKLDIAKSLARSLRFGVRVYGEKKLVIDDNDDYNNETGQVILVGAVGDYQLDENGLPQNVNPFSIGYVNGTSFGNFEDISVIPVVRYIGSGVLNGTYHIGGVKDINLRIDTLTSFYNTDNQQDAAINKTTTFTVARKIPQTGTGAAAFRNAMRSNSAQQLSFDDFNDSFVADNNIIVVESDNLNGGLNQDAAKFFGPSPQDIILALPNQPSTLLVPLNIRSYMNLTTDGVENYNHVLGSYLSALGAKGGMRIHGSITGVERVRPHQYITISSGTNELIDGKSFRFSKIKYDLIKDVIEFEAYEF